MNTETLPHTAPASVISNFEALSQDVDLSFVPSAFKKSMKTLGATARDHVAVPIDQIQFRDNYNVRVHNAKYKARVERLANLMLANGYQQDKPITGFVTEEGGKPVAYVIAGHTRVLAARRANEQGAGIEFIPMLSVPKGTNEIDLMFDLVISNEGSPLSLFEQGVVNQRLISRGVSISTIATRQDVSEAQVRNSLDLLSAPRSIIEHVSDGHISETYALELMRKHGNDAAAMIETGLETAKTMGRTRVTSAVIEGPKMPARVTTSAVSAVQSIMGALDHQAIKTLTSEAAQTADAHGLATVRLPVQVLEQLLALHEQIEQVKQKHAKKAARAEQRAQSDVTCPGAM